MKFFLTYLIMFIILTMLIYYINQETGIVTTITFIAMYIYVVIGIHGNKIYSDKLHAITEDISSAIHLIRQRLK